MSPLPDLSVLVTARTLDAAFAPCLDALLGECAGGVANGSIEIVAAGAGAVPPELGNRFAGVIVMATPEGTPVATTRAAALRRARGRAIACTDPACRVAPGWLATVRCALAEHPVVGGAVEPCAGRVRDWAAYWCEYGHYLPPLAAGQAADLTGNNVAYRREALAAGGALDPAGRVYWKATVHRRLRAAAIPLWAEPRLVVRHERAVAFAPFLRRRFHHGRCFAATRAAATGRRWRYVAGVPLLPAVFLARLYASVWPKGRYRRELLLATPLLWALYAVWSAGEWAGALLGPGDSCERAY